MPSLFHQDPRYFYKGTGTIRSRTLYAIKSAFICRGDNGKPEFDFSHIVGDFAAGTLSNLYYPESNEGKTLVFTNGLIEIAARRGRIWCGSLCCGDSRRTCLEFSGEAVARES